MKLKKIYLSTPLAILSSLLPSCTIIKRTNYQINNQFKDVFSKFYNSYMYYGLLANNSNVTEWKNILDKYYVGNILIKGDNIIKEYIGMCSSDYFIKII